MLHSGEKCSVFITGATGFVGTALIRRLLREHVSISAAVLAGEDASYLPNEVEKIVVAPLSERSDYSTHLKSIDVVIHLAARVHIMQDTVADPLQEFRRVNLFGTERLAEQSVAAGVKRFVFMSTIGVNGNSSGENPFTEKDSPNPYSPYSFSKLEAENCLKDLSKKAAMEVVIVRAPLVYGPGNPGNFLALFRVISKGIPLPLASVVNQKSFLYVDNLADALVCCSTHHQAAGQTFLVSDGENVSTPELIRQVATALGRTARLLVFPPPVMRLVGTLVGKSLTVNSLLASLVIDSTKINRELGWVPPFTMAEGLAKTAKWYRNKSR